jgi:hypothetical protein
MVALATIIVVWAAIATVFVAACISAARADRRMAARTLRFQRTVTLSRQRARGRSLV